MKLKINDYTWEFKLTPQDKLKEMGTNKEPGVYYFGMCCSARQIIYIADCIHKDRLECTIIHELVHAFIDVKNIANQTECDFANFFADNYSELLNKAEEVYKWAKEELYGEV